MFEIVSIGIIVVSFIGLVIFFNPKRIQTNLWENKSHPKDKILMVLVIIDVILTGMLFFI